MRAVRNLLSRLPIPDVLTCPISTIYRLGKRVNDKDVAATQSWHYALTLAGLGLYINVSPAAGEVLLYLTLK